MEVLQLLQEERQKSRVELPSQNSSLLCIGTLVVQAGGIIEAFWESDVSKECNVLSQTSPSAVFFQEVIVTPSAGTTCPFLAILWYALAWTLNKLEVSEAILSHRY